jgi:diguanylate cyclase (GGDEF)-like protein/PAS domain S-box-containing protein
MFAGDSPSFEASQFLLAALDQASDAVAIIDHQGMVVRFNAAAERMWGMPAAEILGRDAACLGLDLSQRHDRTTPSAPADGTEVRADRNREITVRRKDGSLAKGALSLSRVEVGGAVNTMMFVRDITAEVNRRERLALMSMVADRTNRAVVVTDRNLRILYTNAAFAGILGYSPAEARGQRAIRLVAGRYTDRRTLARLRRLAETDDGGEEDILAYAKNGDEVWISTTINGVRDEQGRIKYLFALLTDIGETRQLRSLQQLILGALADELPLAEIATQLCRRVEILAPDVVCSVLHVDDAGLIHPLGGPSLPEDYSSALDGVAIGPEVGSCGSAAFHGKAVLATDIDADPRWQPYKTRPLDVGLRACWSTPITAKDGRVIGTFAFYFRECRGPSPWHQRIVDACVQLSALAIERKEARSQIARLAYRDTLTGLPNRLKFRELVDEMIAKCPSGNRIALLFLDLDHFKDVNDTLGHSAGDELLVALADCLRSQIGENDLLARLGGDEFVVVLPNCDAAGGSRVACRINQALSRLRLRTRSMPMSTSIGISIYPDNASTVDALMQQADAAMYEAKKVGRSTHRLFSADMNRLAEQRLSLGASLREAIANDALKLFYQPQIRIEDGALHGLEALARWYDPVLGEVSPAKFIPLAEDCGLIEQIGQWSIREACRQMSVWARAGVAVPCVSINLSPRNFQNPGLAAFVIENIQNSGLSPEQVVLEITESVFMNERSTAIATMKAIRELGVGLSLDDFGTGYSSLSRLTQLPIRELKIDRSFMRDIEGDPSALAIATAVVRVGQGLKMTVVAEGVETRGQYRLAAALGCDVVQGFLFAPALSAEALERWLVGYAADRAGAMLRHLRKSLARPPAAVPNLNPKDEGKVSLSSLGS